MSLCNNRLKYNCFPNKNIQKITECLKITTGDRSVAFRFTDSSIAAHIKHCLSRSGGDFRIPTGRRYKCAICARACTRAHACILRVRYQCLYPDKEPFYDSRRMPRRELLFFFSLSLSKPEMLINSCFLLGKLNYSEYKTFGRARNAESACFINTVILRLRF